MITSYLKYITKINENIVSKKIPTYEDAKRIVAAGVGFYENVYMYDGYKISIFNYRITTYADFERFFDLGSLEMRGLTFVFNEDGSLYKHFIMLNKFWNIGENYGNLIDDFKQKKIVSVMNKEDGSLITFIELPNGKVIGKTKMGLDNDQAIAVNKIYNENEAIKKFVNYCLQNNLAAMFEFVSPLNRIVLKYTETDLILIRVRDNNTGKYIDIRELDAEGITLCPFEEKYTTVDQMLADADILEDKEGWVVSFDDDSMCKIKTQDYFRKHRLAESVDRENDIIALILDEKIDDFLAEFSNDDKEILDFINGIITKVNKYYHKTTIDVQNLVDKYNEISQRLSISLGMPDELKERMIKKEFALTYGKERLFGLAIHVVNGHDIYDVIKEHILRVTKNLEDARRWLKNN